MLPKSFVDRWRLVTLALIDACEREADEEVEALLSGRDTMLRGAEPQPIPSDLLALELRLQHVLHARAAELKHAMRAQNHVSSVQTAYGRQRAAVDAAAGYSA